MASPCPVISSAKNSLARSDVGEAGGYGNMGRSQGVVVRPQACDGHCGCFVDTLRVRKLEDWPGLILEALEDS